MVRRYDPDRTVPEAVLTRLLDLAVRAPSAGFSQGWDFLVLRTPETVGAFWAATTGTAADVAPEDDGVRSSWLRGMRTAPVLVLCLSDPQHYLDRYAEPDKGWTDRDPARWPAPYWYVDAGMAVLAMLLTATDSKLGACFFGIPAGRISRVRDVFGVPEAQLSVGVLSLGYPAPDPVLASPARRPRRSASELIYHERWANSG